jgi:RNA polymerase sigma-70 factor (ECF subfamily)
MIQTIPRKSALAEKPENTTLSDAELIVRCQLQDREAFRTLVERYRRRAWKVAYNMVGNAETARDLSQEAFIRVLRAIDTCDPERGFRQWFDRVVVNLAIDHLRKARKMQTVTLEAVAERASRRRGPAEDSSRQETRARVHETLKDLPPKYGTVLAMRDIEGRDCEEIAKILGKSSGTIRWRLNRAREMFKRHWERRNRPGPRDTASESE